jgi:hypothetical protein
MQLILWSLVLGVTNAFVASPSLSKQTAAGVPGTTSSLRDINDRMAEQMGVPEVHSDNEWHPRDPAQTTPQLLAALWHQITQAGSMSKGVRCFSCFDCLG